MSERKSNTDDTRISLSSSTALNRLALGLAASATFGGYGRGAYAGTCFPLGAPGTYLCSGAANSFTDITQSFGPVAGDLIIIGEPDFGLDTSVSGGAGIEAEAEFSTGSDDINISLGNVTGKDYGIRTNAVRGVAGPIGNYTGHETRIDTTEGAITATDGTGIMSYGETSSIEITTTDVTAEGTGIRADLGYGYDGTVNIDTTAGTVIGKSDAAISAASSSYTGYGDPAANVSITTADATGGTDGIRAYANTYGNEIVIDTTAGIVEGQSDKAIKASSRGFGSASITTGDLIGGTDGLYFDSGLYNDTEINTTAGIVIGKSGNGIAAGLLSRGYYDNGPASTFISIASADVVGGTNGIYTNAGDFGDTAIDTTAGSVTGEARTGIRAKGGFSEVIADTADVTGATDGIHITSSGLELDTTSGSVTGQTGTGIKLDSYYGYTRNYNIVTSDVSGHVNGIDALIGDGKISIDTTAGKVSAKTGDGITAMGGGVEIDITTSDVKAGGTGIKVAGETLTHFDGTTYEASAKIKVLGDVSGNVGIDTSEFGGKSEISISGSVEGTSGVALNLGSGQQHVTFYDEMMGMRSLEPQGIFGRSMFGDDDDMLSFVDFDEETNILYVGSFGQLFDGGGGTDKASFSLGLDQLARTWGVGQQAILRFSDGMGQNALLNLLNFEQFMFAGHPDTVYTRDQLRDLAPVPLPAGLLLMGSAIGALGLSRRIRRGADLEHGMK